MRSVDFSISAIYNINMKLLERDKYAVARTVIEDAVKFEDGKMDLSDERGASVCVRGWHKCVFRDTDDFVKYINARGIKEKVCLLGAPLDTPQRLGAKADACKTYAYMKNLPPPLGSLSVKRLAHTLAGVVADSYDTRGEKMPVPEMEKTMRDKGVFGALVDSKLAGFIGRHIDGSMGMLTVFDDYRRRGIGAGLEAFMINYVMTFGRVPFCDVYIDNAPSLGLQEKLGMTASEGYTFWIDKL